uniref:Uncharacterized protein n=1 Tax=Acrobeloides nanus TaxID=290746 RepID=A0A914EFU9_9BILA
MPERKWDFTVDALGAYDTQAGEVYLIDMTGHSADDVCGRIIGLSHLNKEQWLGDDLIKVLRYYLLEADGFISNDRDLDEFVNKQVRKLFSLQKVQEFYCFYIYNGVYQTRSGSSECHHPPLDSRSSRLLFKMNELLLEDLHEFYHNFIKPAVDEMKLVNVNQQAWAELSIPAKFPEANLEIRQFRLENVSSGDLRTRMISTGIQHKREPSHLRKQVDENRLLQGNRPSVKPSMKKDEPNSANSHSSTSLWTSILIVWLLFGQLGA